MQTVAAQSSLQVPEELAAETPVERNSDQEHHHGAAAVPAGDDHASSGDATAANAPQHYIASLLILVLLLVGSVGFANRVLSPSLHMPQYKVNIAETLVSGQNFGLFDLNIDIRGIRRAQFALLETAPEVILLGASHWQEANAMLMPGHEMMNAHVHRDYYDDALAAVELLIRNDLLPKSLIIAVRDATFASVDARKDYLWLPFIPEYRAMERRLGLERRPWYEDHHLVPEWGLFSLETAASMLSRALRAEEHPGPTRSFRSNNLDILTADGSIRWSKEHLENFTVEASRQRALEMAYSVRAHEPEISQDGVTAFRKLLLLLQQKGVQVILAHPPFNPIFFDEVKGTPYEAGLKKVVALTRQLAAETGAKVAGSFDPRDMGCTSSMYIDSEHSRPTCLALVLEKIADKIDN